MASDADCIFCKILKGEIPCFDIHEDDKTLAFMDINPANPGHALIIPKFHAPTIFDMREDMLSACILTARRVAMAAREVVPADGFNIVQANGDGAGQSVPHFHIHVVPRLLGDDLKLNWGLAPGDMDKIAAIGKALKAELGARPRP